MEGKGRESHRGCLLPRVDKQEMGRCGGQVARRARGGGERSSGGAGWETLRVRQGACRHGSRDGEPAFGHWMISAGVIFKNRC
jgi:hypothetical protein